ncbi:MAG TPA: response regulator transcription factor [Cyclobacteriaceae bacterium]|nr:response regulator transcription factor [Cyclobacteriaceae bacterium]
MRTRDDHQTSFDTRRGSIAIADDHRLFRYGICHALRQSNHFDHIYEADDGMQLLELLSGHKVNVALLDYRMPNLDGYTTAEKILCTYPDTKVIVLTMYSEPAIVSGFMRLGVHGYLNKNTDIDRLLMAIHEVETHGFFRLDSAMSYSKYQPSIHLTLHERQLISLLAKGLSSEEIGQRLNTNSRTIESQRARLQHKFSVKNTTELTDFAHRLGIL